VIPCESVKRGRRIGTLEWLLLYCASLDIGWSVTYEWLHELPHLQDRAMERGHDLHIDIHVYTTILTPLSEAASPRDSPSRWPKPSPCRPPSPPALSYRAAIRRPELAAPPSSSSVCATFCAEAATASAPFRSCPSPPVTPSPSRAGALLCRRPRRRSATGAGRLPPSKSYPSASPSCHRAAAGLAAPPARVTRTPRATQASWAASGLLLACQRLGRGL
jgi:hypothetical protein